MDEIDRYDSADARLVSDFIREHASLDHYLDRLEEMHRDVIAEGVPVDSDALIHRLSQSFVALAIARQAATEVQFRDFVATREAELRTEFHEWAKSSEAALQAAFAHRAGAREAELLAEFQGRSKVREAEFEADFQAYRDWVAPRNLGHRIINKIRRILSRT
jgi:hypothetical protein